MPLLLCRDLVKWTEWRVEVEGESFTLGGGQAAAVPLPDRGLAEIEAVIRRRGAGSSLYSIEEVAGSGRVLLNDAPVGDGALRDGDRLRLGQIAMVFFAAPPASRPGVSAWIEPAPPPPPPPPARGRGASFRIPRAAAAALAAGAALGILLGIVSGGAPRAGREPPPPPPAGSGPPAPAIPPAPAGGRRDEPSAPVGAPRGQDGVELARSLREIAADLRRARAGREADGAAGARSSPPPPAALPADDPAASRRRLFRLFLDLLGRPPTRAEERELFPLAHEARWRRLVELGAAATLERTPAADGGLFAALLGRPPSAAELEAAGAASDPARPPPGAAAGGGQAMDLGLLLTALPEYADPARRRPRGPELLARSLLVDLLDRPPRDDGETALVAAAAAHRREAACTLLLSSETSPAEDPPGAAPADAAWEAEFFRFLLRPPDERERREIAAALAALPAADRRRHLLLALALHPAYESY